MNRLVDSQPGLCIFAILYIFWILPFQQVWKWFNTSLIEKFSTQQKLTRAWGNPTRVLGMKVGGGREQFGYFLREICQQPYKGRTRWEVSIDKVIRYI